MTSIKGSGFINQRSGLTQKIGKPTPDKSLLSAIVCDNVLRTASLKQLCPVPYDSDLEV